MMVIFLVGLVSMILMRTLRKDYARYSKEDDLDDMVFNISMHNIYTALHFMCISLHPTSRKAAVYNIVFLFCQERDLGDEYGWKQVHGDVFRMPALPTLLSSLIGCGYHLVAVTVIVIILVIMGDLYMG